jgi:hypothetical protein
MDGGNPIGGGSGLTLVGLSAPSSVFSVANSPLIANGTIALSLISQTQRYVFAAPTSGAGVPGFRALTIADISDFPGTPGTVTSFSFTNANTFTGTVSTATTTPTLTLVQTQASGSTNGYLSSTDWTTFNNKGSGNGTVTSTSIKNNGNIVGTVSTATTTPELAINLTTTGVSAGTYGGANVIPVVTTDIYGRISSVTTASGSTGSGTVTNFVYTNNGNLTGTVSSDTTTPTLVTDLTNIGTAGTYGAASVIPVITTDIKGRVSSITTVSASGGGGSGTVTSVSVVGNSSIIGTVSTATTTPAIAVDLTNIGTAGTYGDSYITPIITTTAKGRVSGVTTVSGRFVDVVAGVNISSYGLNLTTTTTSTALGLKQYSLGTSFTTQSANLVLASGTVSGSSISIRSLVNNDLPNSGVSAATYGSATQIPVITVNSKGVATSITTISGGGGSGTATTQTVNQTSHGFSVGDIVRISSSNTYTKSQADTAENAEVAGIVTAVADANTFTLTTQGQITVLSGLTAGSVYYLSPSSAGAYTATAPSTVNQIKKAVFYAVSATEAIVYNLLGIKIATSASVGTVTNFTFTNANGFTGTVSSSTTTPALTLQRTFDSEVKVHTGNGHGSTNNKIRRWTTTQTNTGSDITYADSATLGSSFTINTTGVYAVSYWDLYTVAASNVGLSLNSTQLTTSIDNINSDDLLMMSTAATSAVNGVSVTRRFTSGDVIRCHGSGTANSVSGTTSGARIVRIG